MVPFEIEIELNGNAVSLWVEQLDYLADENGQMRFDVRGDDRRTILSVNIEAKPENPDFSFEAMQAQDESFSGDELMMIIKTIRDNNNRPALPFNRLTV